MKAKKIFGKGNIVLDSDKLKVMKIIECVTTDDDSTQVIYKDLSSGGTHAKSLRHYDIYDPNDNWSGRFYDLTEINSFINDVRQVAANVRQKINFLDGDFVDLKKTQSVIVKAIIGLEKYFDIDISELTDLPMYSLKPENTYLNGGIAGLKDAKL